MPKTLPCCNGREKQTLAYGIKAYPENSYWIPNNALQIV